VGLNPIRRKIKILTKNKTIMKLQIIPAIKQGLEVIIKNPIILAVVVFYAVLYCLYIYFFVYAPKLGELQELPPNFWLYTILITLISIFLLLIVTKIVYDAVVNNNVSLSEAINLTARRFIFVFIASILYLLIIFVHGFIIGFITTTIPEIFFFILIALITSGIFLSIKFIFITYFILLNNEKIIDSFKKSWQITKGNWWRILGLLLIFLIPIMILSITASVIAVVIDAVQIALILDFIWLLLMGWLISTFTIAYIQLIKETIAEKIT
jgi:hypothetical protein